jgi:salicylate hydroxylase
MKKFRRILSIVAISRHTMKAITFTSTFLPLLLMTWPIATREESNILTTDSEWGQASLPFGRTVLTGTDADTDLENDIREDQEEEVEIAIVGGGLAGLAVAIGLTRAGISCKVYERASQLRRNSQGILAIQPNGMRALQSIHPDLPSMIVDAGCERKQLIITTIHANGTIEDQVHETGEADMKYGRLKIGLTWHKMQQILASLLAPDIVVPSRSLVSFEETDEDILLNFEDIHGDLGHHSRVKAKVAIAADGIFSIARREVVQDETPDDAPIFFGQLNWATVIDTSSLPENVHPPNAVHYFMNEGEPARWMSMINDGGSGQSFWQFRVADPELAVTLSRNRGRGGLGLEGTKEALLPLAKPCPTVYHTLERIPEELIFERAIVGRLPASTWISPGGRLVLVGDSAHGMHPNIAQGANSSFESAAAVVEKLTELLQVCTLEAEGLVDWRQALRSYEQSRKPKVDIVQRFANMMGCFQATGLTPLSHETQARILDWIVTEDPSYYPTKEILDKIIDFDPLSQTGISRII